MRVSAPIVGRTAELRSLVDLCERARTEGSQVAQVVGLQGIGKSAVLAALRRELTDWVVAVAYADDSETMVSFGVVDQLLRALEHGRDRHSGGVQGPDAATMGGALIHAVEPPPGKAGVVLMVDDAHWADPLSIQALGFALRRLQPDPVAVVVTMRTNVPAIAGSALDRLLASPQAHIVRLEGLDLDATCELLVSLGINATDRDAVERLRVHSGGNPLHIRALVAELGETALPDASHRPLPAPKAYASIVTGRLDACGDEARKVVEAAAVLGQRCTLASLAAVAQTDNVTPAVDEAVDHQLLVVSPESDAEVAFEHALVRASVYHSLRLSTRADLHRRAANASGDRLTALRHLVAASVATDRELADELVDAARDEAASGRWAAAAELLTSAAGLEDDPAEALRHRLDAVDCLIASGDTVLAEARFRGLPTMPEVFGHAAYIEARLHSVSGRVEQARRLALRAARSCQPDDADLAARIASLIALVRLNAGRGAASIRWAARSLRLAGDRGLTPLGARASLVFALAMGGHAEEALRHAPREQGDGTAALDGLVMRGVVHLWQGSVGQARADLLEAAGMRSGWTYGRMLALLYLSDADYRLGLWDDAITHGQLGASLADDTEYSWLRGLAHSEASFPLSARGSWQAAEAHIEAARRGAAMHLASRLWLSVAIARLAEARADHRAVVEALSPLDALRDRDGVKALGVQPWQALLAVGLAGSGEVTRARRELDLLDAAVREQGETGIGIALARARAAVALASGHSGSDAASILSHSLEAAPSTESPFERALVELMLGGILRRGRRRGAARDLLVAARGRLEALGAIPYLERCDREMAALGLAPARGAYRDRDQLTPQEVSVANLAAAGMSNREIAGELVISVKTVEFHMSNVFAKLGVTSRARLARGWHAQASTELVEPRVS